MFDWFWVFMYSITSSILSFIDAILEAAKKLCGIDDLIINGKETNLLIYFFTDKTIINAFGITAIVALVLLVLFAIIALFMVAMKEKSEQTIGQVIGLVLRNSLSFLFVPFVMVCVVVLTNTLMVAIYKATLVGQGSLGSFMFVAFGQDCLSESDISKFMSGEISYKDIDAVVNAVGDLADFDYLLSWLTGFIILIELILTVCVFVDRTISIIILFIAAPISIASSVVDEGTRFKLWREQILVKFIIGYGVILCINIFMMLIKLIMPTSVVFFTNPYLNYITKLMFIIGGALTLRKSIVLIGNLVGQGAGGQEFLNNLLSGAATPFATLGAGASAVGGAFGAATGFLGKFNGGKVGNALNGGGNENGGAGGAGGGALSASRGSNQNSARPGTSGQNAGATRSTIQNGGNRNGAGAGSANQNQPQSNSNQQQDNSNRNNPTQNRTNQINSLMRPNNNQGGGGANNAR